jgi:hypothetical protein
VLPSSSSAGTAEALVAFARKWITAHLADPLERRRLLPCIPRFCPDLFDYEVIRVTWDKYGSNAQIGGIPVSGWHCAVYVKYLCVSI